MVERHLAKVNVAGSSLVSRSIFDLTSAGFGRRFFSILRKIMTEKFNQKWAYPLIFRNFFRNIQNIKNGLRPSSVNFVDSFPPGGSLENRLLFFYRKNFVEKTKKFYDFAGVL